VRSIKNQKEGPSKFMDALRDFVRTRGSEYLKDPNISSVGIGYKIKDKKSSKEIAIQFTVNQKAEPEELENLNTKLIPDSIKIKGREVPTDVIQRKFAIEYKVVAETQTSNRKKRLDPILPGISVENVMVTAVILFCMFYVILYCNL
jgi:endonuclease G